MAVVAGVQASLSLESAGFITGLNQATAAMSNMARTGNNNVNNINQGFAKVGASTRALRGQFQNLGFQIQDVVVSLQMGMDPIRVFTQQAGQMAQAFGVTGAAIGITLTAVGAFAGLLLRDFTGASKAAEDAAKALNEELIRQNDTADTLIERFSTLSSGLRNLTMLKLEQESRAATEALKAQETASHELVRGLSNMIAVSRAATELGPGIELPILAPTFDEKTITQIMVAAAEIERTGVVTNELAQQLDELAKTTGDEKLREMADQALGMALAAEAAQKKLDAAKGAIEGIAEQAGRAAPELRKVIEALADIELAVDSVG